MSSTKTYFFALIILAISCSGIAAETVNINTASADRLAKIIRGVGPKKAKAIVNYRNKMGPFKRPWHIIRVKGIGRKTYEKNKHRIVVTSNKPMNTKRKQ